MEPNFYTETATVLNADADFRSLLKPSALLRYVEQVSADHARAFGMDDKFFQDHNVAFLVGKQALQFVRVPRRTEALTLTTRAEHSRRGAIKRITTVTDAAGKLVATVDCRWILVDLTGGHINNAYYLDLACDALPPEVLQAGPVTFAAVNYHWEIPMGDTVELLYAPSEEGWYVQGRHDGRTSFECYLKIGS